MQVKLLHDLIEEIAGVDTGRIVDILFGKKDVNEFLIAKKMDLTINQIRNILYKLSANGLVSFSRKKDKRKGWYIYYWTLKTEKCLVQLEQSLMRKIDNLNNVLTNRKTKRYYYCKPCGIEVSEEKALEHGFTCEECGEVYELVNNARLIRDTKAKITRTEKELGMIDDELKAVREKERKKQSRASKKEAKKIEEKKALLKAAKSAARKKMMAKTKKVAKKKSPVKKAVSKKKIKKKTSTRKNITKKKIVSKKTMRKKAVKKTPAKKKVVKKASIEKKNHLKSKLKKKFSRKK